ncbi:MAG: hypothetical protein V7676_01595 [Parasphingorhabdus sp.]|uniref:hypothetical protein n=1 Tax=Parasphingorhabdus sp. TaxID=2709688 RepID=UPI0030029D42
MKNLEQIDQTSSEPQSLEIIAVLRQMLNQLDALELTVPAIKVAEAIDILKQAQGFTESDLQ